MKLYLFSFCKHDIKNVKDATLSITWLGLEVADANRVMDMELVLEAKIAERFAILSSSLNNFFFTSSDSTIASTTTSAEQRSSKFEVQCRSFKAFAPAACCVEPV